MRAVFLLWVVAWTVHPIDCSHAKMVDALPSESNVAEPLDEQTTQPVFRGTQIPAGNSNDLDLNAVAPILDGIELVVGISHSLHFEQGISDFEFSNPSLVRALTLGSNERHLILFPRYPGKTKLTINDKAGIEVRYDLEVYARNSSAFENRLEEQKELSLALGSRVGELSLTIGVDEFLSFGFKPDYIKIADPNLIATRPKQGGKLLQLVPKKAGHTDIRILDKNGLTKDIYYLEIGPNLQSKQSKPRKADLLISPAEFLVARFAVDIGKIESSNPSLFVYRKLKQGKHSKSLLLIPRKEGFTKLSVFNQKGTHRKRFAIEVRKTLDRSPSTEKHNKAYLTGPIRAMQVGKGENIEIEESFPVTHVVATNQKIQTTRKKNTVTVRVNSELGGHVIFFDEENSPKAVYLLDTVK